MDGKLLRDVLGEERAAGIYRYIEGIEPGKKPLDSEYNRRIALCLACGNLVNAMCRLCGCFAEVRAAKAVNRCPADPPKWERTTGQE